MSTDHFTAKICSVQRQYCSNTVRVVLNFPHPIAPVYKQPSTSTWVCKVTYQRQFERCCKNLVTWLRVYNAIISIQSIYPYIISDNEPPLFRILYLLLGTMYNYNFCHANLRWSPLTEDINLCKGLTFQTIMNGTVRTRSAQ